MFFFATVLEMSSSLITRRVVLWPNSEFSLMKLQIVYSESLHLDLQDHKHEPFATKPYSSDSFSIVFSTIDR